MWSDGDRNDLDLPGRLVRHGPKMSERKVQEEGERAKLLGDREVALFACLGLGLMGLRLDLSAA